MGTSPLQAKGYVPPWIVGNNGTMGGGKASLSGIALRYTGDERSEQRA
jgi:hypothetical protein